MAFLQGVESVFDIQWAPGFKYADVRLAEELQFSVYNFEMADSRSPVASVRRARSRMQGAS